ncbi:MAG: type II CRISPR RNA-guided endonuclease Cas9 [Chitinophagales bacterium]|nr:type II CRISPR RNA-guided endonuclease Cas9 [Chitinophagales bacterium]
MKTILGLDLGTNSIGWALVKEAENANETSSIIKLGVRVIPLTIDEQTNFEKGKSITTNADRTNKRSARRNLQRFKLRRQELIKVLIENKIINKDDVLIEDGKNTTYETLKLRAKSATEKIELDELARVLLMINKKRGYKSSRKAKSTDEGSLIDGMAVAKKLYDENLTVGQFVYQLLSSGKKYIPTFYNSDLIHEFNQIWKFQSQFYTELFTNELYEKLKNKNSGQTWKILQEHWNLVGIQQKGNATQKKLEKYKWRTDALSTQLDLEIIAIVLQEINKEISSSSGYLGNISDRSKELYFNKQTVGQYLHNSISKNKHQSLKNKVFYRQDYLDEFEQIWETQAKHYSILTNQLKEDIRDIIIFYQRKLKSQKSLISLCEFEQKEITIKDKGIEKKIIVGSKVIPKSSPIFQEFKIWQILNNVIIKHKTEKTKYVLSEEDKETLFKELNLRGKLSEAEVLKLLNINTKEFETNYKKGIEGNNTNKSFYNVFQVIVENEGYGFDWNKKSADEINEELKAILPTIGIKPEILFFDSEADTKQASYQFWHLLYSAQDDDKISAADKLIYGDTDVALKKNLHTKFGIPIQYTNLFCSINFSDDYGSLSYKAINKILPKLKEGYEYSEACELVGYNHSNSKTKEDIENKAIQSSIPLLKKNSLRNPVVEKILNQMINLVNEVIENYGNPDEIRIELARELKSSAKEREELTAYINEANIKHQEIIKILKSNPYNIKNPTKNDIIRYKLYEELATNGYKDLYTDTKINAEDLFSKKIDIEHIIPKAKLFDDSFSNKTLAFRQNNLDKKDQTAIDYITRVLPENVEKFKNTLKMLLEKKVISKAKYNKLLMTETEIPSDFINRDLRDTQYIAKKAKELLNTVSKTVVSTTGKITDKLREDWDLINIMKELNLPKYKAVGLTNIIETKDNQQKEVITDWTKRNDHRHHAMDALTVAFTTHNHIQYINNLNAANEESKPLFAIRNKITKRLIDSNGNHKRLFIPPMEKFREEAKEHIESILISFKAKNKVVTRNINKSKKKGKYAFNKKTQLTPRGQLHKETVYALSKKIVIKEEKINASFDIDKINKACNKTYKNLLLKRLEENNNDAKKAFTGKNALSKNPIYIDDKKEKVLPETIKLKYLEDNYTIRKDINKDLKIEKVVDGKIRKILQKRLDEFNGKADKAFADLENNPIWLNKEKDIQIKRVTISGISNALPLHHKKDHKGNLLLDDNNQPIPNDFISTGNNHHVAIYKDADGNLQETVISFFEAVERANQKLPIIDKTYNKDIGWQFLFTMKQNEMFVFPSDDFNPHEIDLMDEKNNAIISKHLFRVQKFTIKDYFFRHHLETTVENNNTLKNITWIRCGLNGLENIIKIRTNHLGKIIQIGEY